MPGEFKVPAVAGEAEILQQLTYNLSKAQGHMVKAANKKRRDFEYNEGDLVFLKIRPHKQQSISQGVYSKLGPRFYDPFRIVQKLSKLVYRLQLPPSAHIHPVFHISQLRKVIGNHTALAELPTELISDEPMFLPEVILRTKSEGATAPACHQLLVKWVDKPAEEANGKPQSSSFL